MSVVFRLFVLSITLLVISSCGDADQDNSQIDYSAIIAFTPNQISSFDYAGDKYFGHLGYESKVLENGNIVFGDRELSNILVMTPEGELKKVVRSGRGPGEVLDAYLFVKNQDGGITVHDQGNKKMIRFDKSFELSDEWIPEPFEDTFFKYAFEGEGGKYIYELSSYSFMSNPDKDREKTFLQYFPETEEYGERFDLKDRPYALMYLENGRLGGAGQVPFSFEQLSAYNPENKTIFIFKSDTDLIAEIDFSFDTLSTIPVNLPSERISEAELDSLKEALTTDDVTSGDFWQRVEELLPQRKAQADKMIYHNGEFWLKSNLRGNYQKWFVVNKNGEILLAVNLPKESILMHVSDEHLGVRLDDVTFALYENPISETMN